TFSNSPEHTERKASSNMPFEDYIKLHREGIKEVNALEGKGENPYLRILADIVPNMNQLSQLSLGIVQVPAEQIDGTATKGRSEAFSRSFLPLLGNDTEFAHKWVHLYDSVINEGVNQTPTAYEYYNRFYIIEGNKRVSVMKALNTPYIDLNVTRLYPECDDSQRFRAYKEFLSFYADTKLNSFYFTKEGLFTKLYALLGKVPGEKWPAEEIVDFQYSFFNFSAAYEKLPEEHKPIPAAEAYLVFLEMYGYDFAKNLSESQFTQCLKKIFDELDVAGSDKPAALLTQPAEKHPGLLSSVFRFQPKTVRCAFIYNRPPQDSGWSYWHELGRQALTDAFGSHVETVALNNVAEHEAQAVIHQLAEDGYDLIFATSPLFLQACIHEAVQHPKTKILNSSLLANYHNIRSYYLRIYEAKFILGAIAGAMAENDIIGYIADYPIYGIPASINAFALGARLTNPRAKIILDWSTIEGNKPEENLAKQGVRIISSRDISAPHLDTRAFGLYAVDEAGTISNLALPVWNWSRVYEGIVRSVMTDAWSEDSSHNAGRALSYYMGMSSGAIDVVCSQRLPFGLRRLADILQTDITSGALLPFLGPFNDQEGNERVPAETALIPQEIIDMDYLVWNVVGSIPPLSQLTESAQNLVKMQGIKAAVENSDQTT
ncbi:MAG: BMP family ABC transporter substrate-binding protein, partial [Clostridia bacterium]|nr:BMP family ABC transporter substrate-binding protein [Clostridia bacterium]